MLNIVNPKTNQQWIWAYSKRKLKKSRNKKNIMLKKIEIR
jgi:hypothetical protein